MSIAVRTLGGAEVLDGLSRWAECYEDVYADALDLPDHGDPPIADRLSRHVARPGFRLYAGFDDGELAGYLYAYSLPEDTLWWDGFEPDRSVDREAIAKEWPGRTAAACEVLVRRPWRRRGAAQVLHDAFLADRDEERAAGFIADSNDVVLAHYASYGWSRAGRLMPYPGWRPHIAIVRDLR